MLEDAIGYDCRRLHDGRAAVFKHTYLHRIARRAFFERRDSILILMTSSVLNACVGSHPKFNVKASLEAVEKNREDLISTMFPYLEDEVHEREKKDYSAYFDELDAYEAEKRANRTNAVSDSGEK